MAERCARIAVVAMAARRISTHRLRLWAALAVLAIAPTKAERVTIATYNVANYNVTDRVAEGVYRPQYPKPESEKAALRRVIRELDADVLALQEIGGSAFLRELQRDLRSEGIDYPYAAILETGPEPRHLAVLSRRRLLSERRHDDLTFSYFDGVETVRRGLLEVEIATEAGALTLFVVHLKSRYTERPDDPMAARWRAGEAVALRDRIRERCATSGISWYVVAGDFNAAVRERPVQAFLQRGSTVLAHVLDVADSRGERWTHHYTRDDSYSRVDHLLVSPALLPAVEEQRGRILDTSAVRVASDHRPLVIRLELE